MEVVCGKGFVEIKLKGVNKGVAAQIILQKLSSIRGQPDFVGNYSHSSCEGHGPPPRCLQWEMTSLMS